MGKTSLKITRPATGQRPPKAATLAFRGKLFDVWQWSQKLPGGARATFETIRRPDTVLVLPVVAPGTVMLVRERQPGTRRMLRTIGGRVQPGEKPEAAARRELLEETGYAAGELRLWSAWQPVNKLDWAVYLFVAHALGPRSRPTPDAGESIRTARVAAATLLRQPARLGIDDNELLFCLFRAHADPREMRRVESLLAAEDKRA